jgi:hypothetical protein
MSVLIYPSTCTALPCLNIHYYALRICSHEFLEEARLISRRFYCTSAGQARAGGRGLNVDSEGRKIWVSGEMTLFVERRS